MATIAKIFKNRSGFLLALLLMFFIGTAAVMARTLTDDKKDKAPTEKKGAVEKKLKKQDPVYYWYTVNDSGEIVAGSQAYGGVTRTAAYATTNLPCDPGEDADCVRGFNNPISSFPTTATGITRVKKSN